MASEVLPPLKVLRMATEFPPDVLLFHILPKLPARSVFRFKRVSKQWKSFLSTQMFKKMHVHHVTNNAEQNDLKLFVLSRAKQRLQFCTLDCEAPELGLTAMRPLPFYTTSLGMTILSSFHGLLCVGITNNAYDYEYVDIVLWNPVTAEYKILSKNNSQLGCYRINGSKAFELYYSSYDDDYKLLRVIFDDDCGYIYSLKSDSWWKVGFLKDFRFKDWILSTWLDEKLYILTLIEDSDRPSYYSVIRFDLKTEKITEIEAPSFEQKTVWLSFTVLKGSVHFWVINTNLKVNSMELSREIELWRMGEDEKWTKVVTYWWVPSLTSVPQPLHVMKNGKWLMHLDTKTKGNPFYILDMVKNKNNNIPCSYNAETMAICSKGKYIETFVSPNQYIK